MTLIIRKTEVLSVSLPKLLARKLTRIARLKGQSNSSFVASLIEKEGEEERWKKIYKLGETARKFKITSEEDIDRILHDDEGGI